MMDGVEIGCMGTGGWLAGGLDPAFRIHFLATPSWLLVSGSWLLVPGSWFLVPGFWLWLYDALPDWCNAFLTPGSIPGLRCYCGPTVSRWTEYVTTKTEKKKMAELASR